MTTFDADGFARASAALRASAEAMADEFERSMAELVAVCSLTRAEIDVSFAAIIAAMSAPVHCAVPAKPCQRRKYRRRR